MTDADHFRAKAARCLTLRREAKRGDVQQALHCLAREYEAKAHAMARPCVAAAIAPTRLRLPLAWPALAMQRQMVALLRASFAFWLSP